MSRVAGRARTGACGAHNPGCFRLHHGHHDGDDRTRTGGLSPDKRVLCSSELRPLDEQRGWDSNPRSRAHEAREDSRSSTAQVCPGGLEPPLSGSRSRWGATPLRAGDRNAAAVVVCETGLLSYRPPKIGRARLELATPGRPPGALPRTAPLRPAAAGHATQQAGPPGLEPGPARLELAVLPLTPRASESGRPGSNGSPRSGAPVLFRLSYVRLGGGTHGSPTGPLLRGCALAHLAGPLGRHVGLRPRRVAHSRLTLRLVEGRERASGRS